MGWGEVRGVRGRSVGTKEKGTLQTGWATGFQSPTQLPHPPPSAAVAAAAARSVRLPPPTHTSSQTPRPCEEPSPIHPARPPQTGTSRESHSPENAPCSHGHGHASRAQSSHGFGQHPCPHPQTLHRPTAARTGPRPGQTGTQTHPWGPPVTLTAAEQDGRPKARTAAAPRGPRRCPRCPRRQRPSARPCPRRRPTSLASAGPRAGAAAGPRRTGRREGPGRGCGPAGAGAGPGLKTAHAPPSRGRPRPARPPPPARPRSEPRAGAPESRIPVPLPGSPDPGPRQPPQAPSGSRAGGTVGLADPRRLGQEKQAGQQGFGLPPGGSLPGFLGGGLLRNMLGWSPLIMGDRNHPEPRHGSLGGEGPQGARAGPRLWTGVTG